MYRVNQKWLPPEKKYARRLLKCEGKHDRVDHPGTDRFLVLRECADHASAAPFAEAIAERLRGLFDYAGVALQLEIRMGVVVFPTDGNRASELLPRADLAPYRAKEAGAAIGFYSEGDESSHRHRLAILGELKSAITSDELELHYQPKVDATTGSVKGCEALVRRRHPHRGFIVPVDFVPHAERTGAIRAVTMWVLAAAMRDMKVWHERAFDIDVSVNVSPTKSPVSCRTRAHHRDDCYSKSPKVAR